MTNVTLLFTVFPDSQSHVSRKTFPRALQPHVSPLASSMPASYLQLVQDHLAARSSVLSTAGALAKILHRPSCSTACAIGVEWRFESSVGITDPRRPGRAIASPPSTPMLRPRSQIRTSSGIATSAGPSSRAPHAFGSSVNASARSQGARLLDPDAGTLSVFL